MQWLGYGLDVPGIVFRFLARDLYLLILQAASGAHLAFCSVVTRGSFPEGKLEVASI
jgi:hypothetical protein